MFCVKLNNTPKKTWTCLKKPLEMLACLFAGKELAQMIQESREVVTDQVRSGRQPTSQMNEHLNRVCA